MLMQWGDSYIDDTEGSATPARDRRGNDLGVSIYEAFYSSFDTIRSSTPRKANVVLTVDLRAKIMRTVTLQQVFDNMTRSRPEDVKRRWIGERVMYNREKKGTLLLSPQHCDCISGLR